MSIIFEDVSFQYKNSNKGVSNINLEIQDSELFAILGPSGSGKSTLLNLISGLCHTNQGSIYVGGKRYNDLPIKDRNLGIVFQDYSLFPLMSVRDNIAYPLKVRNYSAKEIEKKVDEIVEKVSLKEFLTKNPTQLSGGQRQRVALGRALVFEPAALLLDEPLSALDANLRVEMREEIRRIQKVQDITTLIVTHDQDEALTMADRIGVIKDGMLEQVSSPKEIYDYPKTLFIAKFFGRANVFKAKAVEKNLLSTSFGKVKTNHELVVGDIYDAMLRPERIELNPDLGQTNTFLTSPSSESFFGPVRRFKFHAADEIIQADSGIRGDVNSWRIPEDSLVLFKH